MRKNVGKLKITFTTKRKVKEHNFNDFFLEIRHTFVLLMIVIENKRSLKYEADLDR